MVSIMWLGLIHSSPRNRQTSTLPSSNHELQTSFQVSRPNSAFDVEQIKQEFPRYCATMGQEVVWGLAMLFWESPKVWLDGGFVG
jgi:hypothetical protein